MGKIGKDFKSLVAGEDGTNTEPEDFKKEVTSALKDGIITKPEGALLIATKLKVDKDAVQLTDNQEKDVKKINPNEVYNSLEEELAAKKEKEEKERKRRKKEADVAREMAEEMAKKKATSAGTSKKVDQAKNKSQDSGDKIRD